MLGGGLGRAEKRAPLPGSDVRLLLELSVSSELAMHVAAALGALGGVGVTYGRGGGIAPRRV